jgi:hypothetical protein
MWSENAQRLVPRGQIEWTDAKGGLHGSVGLIGGKPVAIIRKGLHCFGLRIEGWQWEVTEDKRAFGFNIEIN